MSKDMWDWPRANLGVAANRFYVCFVVVGFCGNIIILKNYPTMMMGDLLYILGSSWKIIGI